MGGIQPKKVYVYSNKGSFIEEFSNSVLFSKKYNLSTNSMSVGNKNILDEDIFMINKETFASYYRVGKKRIRLFVAKLNSPYVRKKKHYKKDKERIIDCYNLNGELIASFKDEFYLKALLGIKTSVSISKTEAFNNTDLKFKYGS
jgi:hypothetical protein